MIIGDDFADRCGMAMGKVAKPRWPSQGGGAAPLVDESAWQEPRDDCTKKVAQPTTGYILAGGHAEAERLFSSSVLPS